MIRSPGYLKNDTLAPSPSGRGQGEGNLNREVILESFRKGVFSAFLILIASSVAQRSALAQSVPDESATPARAKPDAEAELDGAQNWTCAMHPQIRSAKAGKCPICALGLTPVGDKGRPNLASLHEMLAIALKHNPDVRAAEAKVRSVEAELDQTRLEVVQKLIAFREKWQAQEFAVKAAERELVEAARVGRLAKQGLIASRTLKMAAAAKEALAFQRTKLAEVEAELPFLLGHAPGKAAPKPGATSRKLIRDELLPKARQMLEVRTREFRTGNASVLEVAAAQRQFVELEFRLAGTNKQKIAAIESQKQLLKEILAITEALYKAGEVGQGDVLAIELELSKLDLRLLELKGE